MYKPHWMNQQFSGLTEKFPFFLLTPSVLQKRKGVLEVHSELMVLGALSYLNYRLSWALVTKLEHPRAGCTQIVINCQHKDLSKLAKHNRISESGIMFGKLTRKPLANSNYEGCLDVQKNENVWEKARVKITHTFLKIIIIMFNPLHFSLIFQLFFNWG